MKILAFAEQRDNKLKKPALEAVKAARTLADQLNGKVVALVIGENVQAIAASLGGYGAHEVLYAEDARLARYAPAAYARVIADAATAHQASIVVMAATALGKDLAPRVAVKLDAGLAADCTSLVVEGGEVIATRPVFAGKAMNQIKITSAVKMFTLRPNVFSAGDASGATASVAACSMNLSDGDFSCVVRDVKQSSGKLDVAEANIIVTGGRGMKGPEGFGIIEELAGALGAAVGASRAVVDAGWRPHEEQVGQTGKTVAPSLYVAVAVSGAIQHLAGMSSSKYIVAVNKDKDAPIFSVATYGIVGDAFEIVPALTAEVKKLLGKA
jgi:electron transfer flavoprotein alpha subunit